MMMLCKVPLNPTPLQRGNPMNQLSAIATRRKIVASRYKAHYPFAKYTCAYCKTRTLGRDHVPAVINSYCYGLDDYPHLLVPCCSACNSILGDRPFHTMLDRAEYVYARYETNGMDILAEVFWTEDEILTLGELLQIEVRAMETRREALERILTQIEEMISVFILDEFYDKN